MSPLEVLRSQVTAAGWCADVRTDGPVPLLRVWHSSFPAFGDSVSARTGPDGTRSFYSSTGQPLAPCDDVTAARDEVIGLLSPFVQAAARSRAN